jgi:two-component system, NtrC family, response regulator AtoC
MSGTSVLVIDDEPGLRQTLEILLGEEGYAVRTASDGEEGLKLALRDPPDLILCDVRMPRMGGLDFLQAYGEAGGGALVIMMSAYGTLDSAVEALRKGAYDFVSKPFNADEVVLTLRKAEEREQLRQEVQKLRRQVGDVGFKGIVGRSGAMREVLDLAATVAPYPSSVLITGESGTGKEALARGVHESSPRAREPFIPVNCGALPEALIEAELFGHEKGAFTGAERARPGLFVEARGGTLFLDEIGELPPSVQVKLLRALQERRVRPLGSATERDVDVRVIAATARDLDEEVAAGRFREDLFFRINVVRLHLPPLRARPEDVPLLASHFVAKHGRRLGLASTTDPGGDVLKALSGYSWPGNVRELENVMERALILSAGAPGVQHLPDYVVRGEDRSRGRDDDADLSVKRRLPSLEKELIARALTLTHGNRTRAAEMLELSVKALSYKIRDYGLG